MKNFLLGFGSLLVLSFAGCGSKDTSISNYFKADKIYKIVPSENYDVNNEFETVKLLPLDVESGFIHTVFGNQVEKILNKFFADHNNVLVLELDQNVLAENGIEIRKEQNHAGGDYFPHLYGKQQIPAKSVVAAIKVDKISDGSWVIVE
jgi:uncharacterized protein (DUF952 family)